MEFKKLLYSIVLFTISLSVSQLTFAQAPAGYYADAEGKTAYELKTELFFIIDNHTDRGYSALWDLYYTSDDKPNGKVWDMYSDVPNGTPPYEFTFGNDQCGNYSGEGSCYNREHSFPKSWFNDAAPMVNDAHHIVPTDGYVNGQRGSFPYGETNNASWTSQNGSKKGSSAVNGYSGTVFEPIDEYKGDFARIYFYMATRYQSQIDSWNSPMLNGTESQAYTDWALAMLLDWHQNDPVSQKEIDRNNAVYNHQGNRNPFVDHPEWVSCIWQNSCGDTETPTVATSLSTINYSTVNFEDAPVVKSFTLTGEFLSSSVSISSDADAFLLSTTEGNYNSSISIAPDANGEISQEVFIQLLPSENSNQNIQATLTISSDEINTSTISLSATIAETVNTSIVLNFNEELINTTVETPIHEVFVYANEKLTEALSFDVKLTAFNNIFFPAQFTTAPLADGTSVPLTIAAGDSVASFIIELDTAQLKTIEDKAFSMLIPESNAYLAGDKDTLYFQLAGFEAVVTALKDKLITKMELIQNPVVDQLHLKLPIQNGHYKIFNQSGQVVVTGGKQAIRTIDISALESGLYLLLMEDKSDASQLKAARFIKL